MSWREDARCDQMGRDYLKAGCSVPDMVVNPTQLIAQTLGHYPDRYKQTTIVTDEKIDKWETNKYSERNRIGVTGCWKGEAIETCVYIQEE